MSETKMAPAPTELWSWYEPDGDGPWGEPCPSRQAAIDAAVDYYDEDADDDVPRQKRAVIVSKISMVDRALAAALACSMDTILENIADTLSLDEAPTLADPKQAEKDLAASLGAWGLKHLPERWRYVGIGEEVLV